MNVRLCDPCQQSKVSKLIKLTVDMASWQHTMAHSSLLAHRSHFVHKDIVISYIATHEASVSVEPLLLRARLCGKIDDTFPYESRLF